LAAAELTGNYLAGEAKRNLFIARLAPQPVGWDSLIGRWIVIA
jgi:hypothetical protein